MDRATNSDGRSPPKLKVRSAMVLDDGREWNRSHMPAELEALLNDPRVQALPDNPPLFPRTRIVLAPETPPRPGQSRYMRCYATYPRDAGEPVWVNEPEDRVTLSFTVGKGLGFANLSETPLIREKARRPKRIQDIQPYSGWYLASARAVELLRAFEPDVIETREMDWSFLDGSKWEGAAFLDICRCIPALDYRNCEVVFENQDGKIVFWGMGAKLTLNHDIDPAFHIFRDDYKRNFMFVTREFARAWRAAKLTGLMFAGLAGAETL